MPPILLPVFATPFGIADVIGADDLNPQVAALVARRRAVDAAAAAGGAFYRSPDDFFERPEPPLRRLAEGIVQGLHAVIDGVNSFSVEQWQSFTLEARGWITVLGTDGAVPAANHPLTAWCGIYCVSAPAPEPAPVRADSGVLRLYESRLGSSFQDATNSSMRIPFQTAHYSWRPAPGQLAVFPGSMRHEIAPLRSPGELVLVTIRARFVASGQQGWGRW